VGPNPILGVLYHWIGGLAAASFYIPYRGVRRWSWETYWLVGGVFSWIVAPWLFAWLLVPDLRATLASASARTLAWAYAFGVLWGLGGLTFGLTMRYLGIALGVAVALGYCAAFGTLIPPIVSGEIGEIAASTSGRVILLGVAVCLLGIALSGLAGRSKERELSSEQKAATIREFDFGKGMLVATFCGVMSSCFAYGLAAGKPLADLTRARLLDHGRADLWQNLPVLIVVLLGGFTTNVVWCVILNARNRSAGEYLAVPGAPRLLLLNYVLSAVAGVVWYLQFFFYSMGQTRMGSYEFSSWTMHMASIIIFSTLWGVALHEWKGTSRKTHGLIASGLAVLVASTILVGYGNFLKGGVVLAQGASAEEGRVTVTWDKVIRVSNTTPTLQVVVNPPLRRGSSIHDRAFQTLRELGCDYVRYVPWLPYPKLAVAELEPPSAGKTSWDFSLIDPMTEDFMEATRGHSVMLNFSTIPQWMFKTDKPVSYPADPDEPTWTYTQGTELRDPSLKELGDYYARLVSWYTNGGFTDEAGKRHESKYKYKFDYWEVLNEPDLEHQTTAQQYTERYDAIVGAIHQVAPGIKFVGVSLAFPSQAPGFFEYFLNPKNHKPGIPLDMISYHFYAVPTADQSPEIQQYTFFEQADKFLDIAGYIENIRLRLSPATKTTVNEIGSIAAADLHQGEPGYVFKPFDESYWHLSGAVYAYVFARLARLGIDVAGESQLVGYPTQFPSVSMVDWETGAPNARARVLQLLKGNFRPGDKLVETSVALALNQTFVFAQGFVAADGTRKLLLVNKRNRPFALTIPGATQAMVVDQSTKAGSPAARPISGDKMTLEGLAVAVVTISNG
jgi:L-rhamnose-proton symport protein (RhaT)